MRLDETSGCKTFALDDGVCPASVEKLETSNEATATLKMDARIFFSSGPLNQCLSTTSKSSGAESAVQGPLMSKRYRLTSR